MDDCPFLEAAFLDSQCYHRHPAGKDLAAGTSCGKQADRNPLGWIGSPGSMRYNCSPHGQGLSRPTVQVSISRQSRVSRFTVLVEVSEDDRSEERRVGKECRL